MGFLSLSLLALWCLLYDQTPSGQLEYHRAEGGGVKGSPMLQGDGLWLRKGVLTVAVLTI